MQQYLAVVVAISIGVIALAIIFGAVLPRLRRNRMRERPIAIAPFGTSRAGLPPRPTVQMDAISENPAAPAQVGDEAIRWAPPPAPRENDRASTPAEGRNDLPAISRQTEQGRVLRMQVAGDPRRSPPMQEPSGRAKRQERPVQSSEGTLQFLPGKLEVIEGRDVGQELRFVATAGPDGTAVTFGRSEGPVYRHVQLYEQTVSRLHARMVFENRGWGLQNLSTTNPVVVNGAPLAADGAKLNLRDGDRIEMGEVVFRYRTR